MPPLPFGKGMKGATAGAAGRGGMRLHATATASASAAAGARGHLVQKSTTHSSAASRTSLGSRPLTAGEALTQTLPRALTHLLHVYVVGVLLPGANGASRPPTGDLPRWEGCGSSLSSSHL